MRHEHETFKGDINKETLKGRHLKGDTKKRH